MKSKQYTIESTVLVDVDPIFSRVIEKYIKESVKEIIEKWHGKVVCGDFKLKNNDIFDD